MNPAKLKRAIEVMQAAIEGASIQCRTFHSGEWSDWADILVPGWDWVRSDYRVKP